MAFSIGSGIIDRGTQPSNSGLFSPSSAFNANTPVTLGSPGTPTNSNLNNAYGSQGAYGAALATSSAAYDDIMKGYKDTLGAATASPIKQLDYKPFSPTAAFYNESPELTNALTYFGNLSKSGGFTDPELSSLRARATSPITSIYENAKMNLDRQRRLSGGYSPSYNAALSRMTRETSQEVGKANTDVEGQIAETLANNRLSASSTYNNALAAREANINSTNQSNAAEVDRVNSLNASNKLAYEQFNQQAIEQAQAERVRALEGMRGLYGTTPALVNEFGNQVAQSRQQASQDANQKAQQQLGYISSGIPLRSIYG